MSTSIKQVFFFIVLLMAIDACKEKDCHKDGSCAEDYRRLRLSDEAQSYLWADTGSWWIYKNTKTGELDTQTLVYFNFDSTISKGTYDYSKHITLEYDILKREIYSTYTQWLYKDETTGFEANGTPLVTSAFGVNRYVSGEGIILNFYIPFNHPGSTYCQYKGIDSTLIIQGKTYLNVARFSINLDPFWKNTPPYTGSVYYWAKDVGLVKRVATSKPDVWELIDYKIVK
ncbi:MAG: hypothetical protein V4613_11170 [Bacteroidota bacterium]